METSSLEWTALRVGPDLLVRVQGELDLAAEAVDLVPALGAEPVMTVVVDCGGVEFCDSSGLQWLLRLRDLAGARSVALRAVPGQLRRVIAMADVESFFDLDPVPDPN